MTSPIYGVAPDAEYDPDLELLYPDKDDPTEKRVVVDVSAMDTVMVHALTLPKVEVGQ